MAQDDKVALHVRIDPELKEKFREAVHESDVIKDMTHGVEFLLKRSLRSNGFSLESPKAQRTDS